MQGLDVVGVLFYQGVGEEGQQERAVGGDAPQNILVGEDKGKELAGLVPVAVEVGGSRILQAGKHRSAVGELYDLRAARGDGCLLGGGGGEAEFLNEGEQLKADHGAASALGVAGGGNVGLEVRLDRSVTADGAQVVAHEGVVFGGLELFAGGFISGSSRFW